MERLADRYTPPSPEELRRQTRQALERFAGLDDGVERDHLRARLVSLHLPLVEHVARRFHNRGEPHDDLVQVGAIGLLKAIDRFDCTRGVEFSTYATPTVMGEIKRHFRDRGWSIRVPRRLQELRYSLATVTADLTQALGRTPTVPEIAEQLEVSEDEVREGIESSGAYCTLSLDAPDTHGEDGKAMAETLGTPDTELERVDYRESLRPLLATLDPRDRRILNLRFFHQMTQSQIAREIGLSQMHVSRLLSRTLHQLRLGLRDTA